MAPIGSDFLSLFYLCVRVCSTEHETGHYFRVNRRQNIALPVCLCFAAGVFLFHKTSFVDEVRFYSFSRIPLRTRT